jgi:hypothetical protein
MDDLTRFARRLVEQLSEGSEGAHRPVAVSLVREKLLPYRVHRRALQLDSVEDYETVLLRLVAGERGFVRTMPPAAALRCQQELAGANPDLGVLDEVAESTIQFTSLAAAQVVGDEPEDGDGGKGKGEGTSAKAATPPSSPRPEVRARRTAEIRPVAAPPPPPPAPASPRTAPPPPIPDQPMPEPAKAADTVATGCPQCRKSIPAGRKVVFCPWCGERLIPFACPRCRTELDSAWQHCITCGAPVKDPHRFE